MALRFTDSPNARSKSITISDLETHGILNRHATSHPTFQIGVAEDRGARRTMEDTHSFVVDFGSIRGQGFFAVFDGHAGKHAAEWCGNHFHEYLLQELRSSPGLPVPDILNQAFLAADTALSKVSSESDGKIHSGCTAVTAFLRVEDAEGKQSFLDVATVSPRSEDSGSSDDVASGADTSMPDSGDEQKRKKKKSLSGSRIRKALRNLGGGGGSSSKAGTPRSTSPVDPAPSTLPVAMTIPPETHRRVLYTANAGDARGVLCRAGKAVRLTYDHKGTDKQEAKRIQDSGGFVMSGRVNGVLAVTRALGDPTMKEWVVGSPYTTETELCSEDEFLILACDGLWDIINDQAAVELVREVEDPQVASTTLVKHALAEHTTDNVTVLVIRFKHASKIANPVPIAA